MKKVFIISILLIVGSTASAQDAQFVMGNQNLMFYNPAFTGTSRKFRANLSYRNQWTGISGSFQTTKFSADQYLGKIGGIGFSYMNDRAGEGTTVDNLLAFNYAKATNYRRKRSIKFRLFWYVASRAN